jgi:hypothetical protein
MFGIKVFRAPDDSGSGGLGDSLPFVSAGLSALQTGIGIVKSIGSKKRINNLIGQLTPYETPDAFYKGLNLTLNNAQGDTLTRDFQQEQLDNAFSSYLSSATRLGADPNDLSAVFGQKIQGLMNVGQQFHQSNLQAFSSLLAGYNALAENKTAEQVSRNNIIKNRIQAENANFKTANDNIGGGLSSLLSSLSSKGIMDLFSPGPDSSPAVAGGIINNIPKTGSLTAPINTTGRINPSVTINR